MSGNIVNVADVQASIIELASRADDVTERLYRAATQCDDVDLAAELRHARAMARDAWSSLVAAAALLFESGIGRPVEADAVARIPSDDAL